MTAKELEDVRRKAAKAALWRKKLAESIQQAHVAGASTRKIADAAGVSHTQIQRMLADD